MDRYTKVEQKKPEIPISENEIRITSQGLVRNYISYATTLLQETHGKEIVLKAMGQAISKTVAIAEIIKRKIPRLHQDTDISSVSITDVWEPIEEGLLPVEMTRHVSMISITLSTKELNKNSPGYQAPLNVERPRPQYNNYQRQHQPRQGGQVYNAVNEEPYGGNYQGNRGRGQGAGRGGRGRGWNRGGYGNSQGGGYGNSQGGGYGNSQGGRYGNSQGEGYENHRGGGGGGHGNNQGRGGYGNYQGGRGYGSYQGGRGYGSYQGRGGYGSYQGGRGYGNYQGGGYGNYQENNGYSNWGGGGGRGGNAGYRGAGYGRGGGRGNGGGRFNGRGRGRMGSRPKDGADQQQH